MDMGQEIARTRSFPTRGADEEKLCRLRIFDPHHHLWDLDRNRYPWMDPGTPSIVGDPAAIRKNYLAQDYLADTSDFDLIGTVHLDGGFDPWNPVGETRFVQTLQEESGFPNAIVGQVALDNPRAVELIEAHMAASPLLRGVRHIVAWHPDPLLRYVERSDYLRDERWLRNFGKLAAYGLSFDTQVYPHQMGDIAAIARTHPETRIVINQAGMPDGLRTGDLAGWKAGMRALSACHNVYVKISGFGMLLPEWTAKDVKPLIAELVDLFGPFRLMFASNFPVDKLFRAFKDIYADYAECVQSLSADEQEAMFSATAIELYRPVFPSVIRK
jgi:predicted TIM-barrel fold metal-dependent hydrolase